MLFTNRNPPKRKKDVLVVTGGNGGGNQDNSNDNKPKTNGVLVYQPRVNGIKKKRSDTINRELLKPAVIPVEKEPVKFGLKQNANQMRFVETVNKTPKYHSTATTSKVKTRSNAVVHLAKPSQTSNPEEVKQWIQEYIQQKVSKITTPKEVKTMVEKSLKDSLPKGLSYQEVESILREKMPKGLSLVEVEKWIHQNMPKLFSPMMESLVNEKVNQKVDQKIPPKVLSSEEVESLVNQKVNQKVDQKIPPKVLSSEEVESLVNEKVNQKVDQKIPPKVLSSEEVESLVNQKIPPKGLSSEEIESLVEKGKSVLQAKIDAVEKCLKALADPKTIVESYVNSKLEETPTKNTIEELVEKFWEKKFSEEVAVNENLKQEDNDAPKTRFEEWIEPAVARIVMRLTDYDYAGGKEYFSMDDSKSVNLDIQYDEVYDYDAQERGLFQAPVIQHQIDHMPNMKNPLLEQSKTILPTINETDSTVENNALITSSSSGPTFDMGNVYGKEDKILFENEMRSEFRSSRKWIRMGSGIEKGSVLDICMDKRNRRVYIVGHFKHVNRVPIENIAFYDMRFKGWNHVGDGIPGLATCIAVHEQSQIVFVGGVFTKAGKGESQVACHNIAAYYVLQKRWVPLGEGLNRDCNTLYFDEINEKLYAGGTFTQTGSAPLHYVGIYDLATNTWSGLYNGEINGPCRTLLKVDDQLLLGGLFTHAGNSDIHVSYVAKYDLELKTWSGLSGGLQGYCNALAYDPKEKAVYVGGTFTSVGDRENSINAHHVAKFYLEHQKWDNMNEGVNNVVHSLCFDTIHNHLYVGGNFTSTYENNTMVNHIAIYNPYCQKWQALDNHFPRCRIPKEDEGSDNIGLNGVCKVLNIDTKSLFIAGSFQIAGNITANSIVRYVLQR